MRKVVNPNRTCMQFTTSYANIVYIQCYAQVTWRHWWRHYFSRRVVFSILLYWFHYELQLSNSLWLRYSRHQCSIACKLHNVIHRRCCFVEVSETTDLVADRQVVNVRLAWRQLDGRSQIKVHTDKRTQAHSAQCSLGVTHPSTNRGRRASTTVNESPS